MREKYSCNCRLLLSALYQDIYDIYIYICIRFGPHFCRYCTQTAFGHQQSIDKLELALLSTPNSLKTADNTPHAPPQHYPLPCATPSLPQHNHPSNHRSVGLIAGLVRRPMTDIIGRSGSLVWHSVREREETPHASRVHSKKFVGIPNYHSISAITLSHLMKTLIYCLQLNAYCPGALRHYVICRLRELIA